ncbi:MAG: synthase subunit gamma [Rickettsiaceae bacterium]|jgi:F-type H+-transporting ATPase subunit gamma|nr:synthase subunit gamma [Rickettsiaceae bacterium]
MANLKDLKNRIKSVQSTRKITSAMKVVSASKLRRAREKAEAAAPYAVRMERMLRTLAGNVSKDSAPKLLVGNGKEQSHLLVVISSDRGLCGGFNTHLLKAVRSKISQCRAHGQEFKIICIGKKGYEQLRSSYKDKIVGKTEGISKKRVIPFEDAAGQAKTIIEMFENGEFDVCTIFYNKFISAISQQVTAQQIIPLNVEQANDNSNNVVYEYEPSENLILNELLPKNIAVQIFHAFLENSASEHGARMSAMDNATRNAGDMIKRLTLVYNRTRQAAITKELIEIISGAEAV